MYILMSTDNLLLFLDEERQNKAKRFIALHHLRANGRVSNGASCTKTTIIWIEDFQISAKNRYGKCKCGISIVYQLANSNSK